MICEICHDFNLKTKRMDVDGKSKQVCPDCARGLDIDVVS